ncbi:MAG: hypothetical protein AB7I18_01000 [Candidatus Berkiella sp.]
MENKPTLSKPVMMIILLVIFAIAIGGYVLFFQSQKRINQKDQEYEQLKAKASQTETSFSDLQKKNDSAAEQIKQLTKENEALTQKNQEAKAKQDDLQAKYDTLLVEHEKVTKELKEKVSAPAPTPTTPPPSTPAPGKSSSLPGNSVKTGTTEAPSATTTTPTQPTEVPPADVPSATITPPSPPADVPSATITPPSPPADVPSATITPPTPVDTPPPPDPQKSSNLTQPSAKSAGVALGGEEFNCPASNAVTQNLATGKWTEGALTWWVDYTRRPIGENESVQKLFKVLFDGQTIACYYEIGNDSEEQAFIVVKASSQHNKLVLKENDGWTPCPTKECEATCANDNLNQCHFKIEKL